MYGPLYYRQLEIEKVAALKQNKGSFDSFVNFSHKARSDLHWWIENITTTSNTVTHGNPQVTIYSDASLTGWGRVLNSTSTGGQWSEDESKSHINFLEVQNCHVKAMIDNTTAISYINSMGGRSLLCNQITRELWVWCAQHGIWLSAVHIPGKQNVLADKESREKRSDSEWKLNPQLFECIIPL